MNPKLFGDTRDLYKYDLITSVIKGFKGRGTVSLIIVLCTVTVFPCLAGAGKQ